MAASACAALTLSAAIRASSASTVTWSTLLPTLIPTAYRRAMAQPPPTESPAGERSCAPDRDEHLSTRRPRPLVPIDCGSGTGGSSCRDDDVGLHAAVDRAVAEARRDRPRGLVRHPAQPARRSRLDLRPQRRALA